jgi:hypothetical protein
MPMIASTRASAFVACAGSASGLSSRAPSSPRLSATVLRLGTTPVRWRYLSMVIIAARMAAAVALCTVIAGVTIAQTSPPPGPTVPPKSLPVPKGGESLVINPTKDECNGGWRPGLRWPKVEFDKFCRQLDISK